MNESVVLIKSKKFAFSSDDKEVTLRPLTKTETTDDCQGQQNVTKIVLYTATDVSKFGHKSGKTEIQQVESYQCKPYIQIPAVSCHQLIKFLIDLGAQHSIVMQWDAEKLGVRYRGKRVKITGVNGASVICQTGEVNLWLLGKK